MPSAADFVPLIVDAPAAPPRSGQGQDRIEIEAGSQVIRLPGTTSAARLAEIVTALVAARA